MRYSYAVMGRVQRPTRGEQIVAFLVRWAILAAAVWVAAEMVDGIDLGGWESTVAVSLILGLLNASIKPILFWLSLPLTIVTFGLFLVILNAVILWLTDWIASWFDSLEFQVRDFWWDAILGAMIISIVSWAIQLFIKPERVARSVAR
jgi:putative membrane protein